MPIEFNSKLMGARMEVIIVIIIVIMIDIGKEHNC